MKKLAALILLFMLILSGCGGGGGSEGSSDSVSESVHQPAATDNLALNMTATSSSDEKTDLGPQNAVDGDITTRWSSAFTDPSWIAIDLGSEQTFKRVKLVWEESYGVAYEIQVSDDNRNWTTVYTQTQGKGGIEDLGFAGVTARYVRLYGTQRATQWGYSLWSFEVYNNDTDTGGGTDDTGDTGGGGPSDNAPKSAKRGIAYDLKDTTDFAAIAPGVSWWYNWGLKPGASTPADALDQYNMEFVPMLWNFSFNVDEVVAYLQTNPDINYLLVLNEPNLTDQANVSPQDAADQWPKYEEVAQRTGVAIVGPAITWGTMQDYQDPVAWLDAFYTAYRNANGGRAPRIDYLAFHWYDYGLAYHLDRLAKYGKSIWVTEFANWHTSNDALNMNSLEEQQDQMADMVATLETRDDVFRYAWFTGRWNPDPHFTSLLGAPGVLTGLGEQYVSEPFQ